MMNLSFIIHFRRIGNPVISNTSSIRASADEKPTEHNNSVVSIL